MRTGGGCGPASLREEGGREGWLGVVLPQQDHRDDDDDGGEGWMDGGRARGAGGSSHARAGIRLMFGVPGG